MEPASTSDSEGNETAKETQDHIVSEEPMLFCPVCDARLISRRCKLTCECCGYFMSCTDYNGRKIAAILSQDVCIVTPQECGSTAVTICSPDAGSQSKGSRTEREF